jgi:hypothetical protein
MKPSIPGLPRGGARKGAGRPRKKPVLAPASPAKETPQEYALRVMQDETADVRRRDAMAKSLLSFLKGSGKALDDPAPATTDRDSWDVILGGKK